MHSLGTSKVPTHHKCNSQKILKWENHEKFHGQHAGLYTIREKRLATRKSKSKESLGYCGGTLSFFRCPFQRIRGYSSKRSNFMWMTTCIVSWETLMQLGHCGGTGCAEACLNPNCYVALGVPWFHGHPPFAHSYAWKSQSLHWSANWHPQKLQHSLSSKHCPYQPHKLAAAKWSSLHPRFLFPFFLMCFLTYYSLKQLKDGSWHLCNWHLENCKTLKDGKNVTDHFNSEILHPCAS